MRWTYTIEDRQVTPRNTRDYEFVYSGSEGYIHDLRISLNGNITLTDEAGDYEYMKELESTKRFEKLTLKVYDNGVLHFEGHFTINKVSFDDYKGEAIFTVQPYDAYTYIQENENVEVNALTVNKYTVKGDVYSYWFFKLIIASFTGPPIDGNYDKLLYSRYYKKFHHPSGLPDTDMYMGVYVSEHIRILDEEDIPFDGVHFPWDHTGWHLYSNLDGYKIYERFPDTFNLTEFDDYQWSGEAPYPTSMDSMWWEFKFLEPPPAVNGENPDEHDFPQNTFGFWVKRTEYLGIVRNVMSRNYPAVLLKDSLNRILSTSCPEFSGTVKSSFLFHDTGATGELVDPVSFYQGLDFPYYVKFLIEKSDFRKPTASQHATSEILKFKDTIEYFCLKHNLRWHIDKDGNLRIEHISYYEVTESGLDLTGYKLTHKYSYKSDEVPNREYWEELEVWNTDFIKKEVLYGTVPALRGQKEASVSFTLSGFATDVDGLNQNIDVISNEGFIYVDTELVDDVYEIVKIEEPGGTATEHNQNDTLSLLNCLNTYYLHNQYQLSFKINGVDKTALSLRKLKLQEAVFTSDSIPEIQKLILTLLGAGEIEKLSYKPVEEYNFKANLIYG